MQDGLIEMQVLGVRRQVPLDQVVVLLLDVDGGRVLPIVVGLSEGQAIAAGQAGVVPPRPMTHDLLVSVLSTVAATVDSTDTRRSWVIGRGGTTPACPAAMACPSESPTTIGSTRPPSTSSRSTTTWSRGTCRRTPRTCISIRPSCIAPRYVPDAAQAHPLDHPIGRRAEPGLRPALRAAGPRRRPARGSRGAGRTAHRPRPRHWRRGPVPRRRADRAAARRSARPCPPGGRPPSETLAGAAARHRARRGRQPAGPRPLPRARDGLTGRCAAPRPPRAP